MSCLILSILRRGKKGMKKKIQNQPFPRRHAKPLFAQTDQIRKKGKEKPPASTRKRRKSSARGREEGKIKGRPWEHWSSQKEKGKKKSPSATRLRRGKRKRKVDRTSHLESGGEKKREGKGLPGTINPNLA